MQTTTQIALAGLAVAAAGTTASIIQAQQSASFTAASQRQQMDLSYQQAQRQTFYQNEGMVNKHIGQVKAFNAASFAANKGYFYGDEAANKSYISQQLKLKEIRDKARFKSLNIYAKSIGAKGRVLAAGGRGQSIGLLALDADRRAGLAQAEVNASLRSANLASAIAGESTWLQATSAKNKIGSKLGHPIRAPQLAPEPMGIGKDLGLGIPSYNWT